MKDVQCSRAKRLWSDAQNITAKRVNWAVGTCEVERKRHGHLGPTTQRESSIVTVFAALCNLKLEQRELNTAYTIWYPKTRKT